MKPWIWIGAAALFALHHDAWLWDDGSLVLGFLPAGLAWHAGFSIAAGLFWALVVMRAWPAVLDEAEPETPESVE